MGKRVKQNQGFSLVELMVSLGIISALVTLSIPAYKSLASHAKATEAVTNTRAMGAMLQAYVSDNQASFMSQATTADFSTETSCQRNNVLGFRIGDCRRANYNYAFYISGFANYSASAFEAKIGTRKRVYPNCSNNMDVWMYDGKSLYHPGNPRSTCASCYYTQAIASLSSFDPTFNFAAVDNAGTGAESIGMPMYFSILSTFMFGSYVTTCN